MMEFKLRNNVTTPWPGRIGHGGSLEPHLVDSPQPILFATPYSKSLLFLLFLSLIPIWGTATEPPDPTMSANNSSPFLSLWKYSPTSLNSTATMAACEICWCHKDHELDCRYRNDESSAIVVIPSMDRQDQRLNILFIIASNQPTLRKLDRQQMSPYANIEKLTIDNGGLETIEPDTFHDNLLLKEISLKNNKLQTISWRPFHGLQQLQDLSLEHNPFRCSCPLAKWIQHLLTQQQNILGPYWKNVTCRSNHGSSERILANFTAVADDFCAYPIIRAEPEKVQIKEGDSITLTCTVTGTPAPTVTWNTTSLESDFRLLPLERQLLVEPEMELHQIRQQLRIDKAHVDDNENIWCQAENDVGFVSAKILVSVHSAPRIEMLEVQQKFFLTIAFRIRGVPYAQTQWLKNGQPLDIDYKTFYEYQVDHPAFINGHLEIRKKTQINAGQYTLVAVNKYGRDQRSIDVNFNQEIISPATIFPGSPPFSQQRQRNIVPVNHVVSEDFQTTASSMETSVPDDDDGDVTSNHHRTSLILSISIVLCLMILIIILLAILFYHRSEQFGWKRNHETAVHESWDSTLDQAADRSSSPRHELAGKSFPLCLFSAARNWLNRKRRLFRARRRRNQAGARSRSHAPKNRAMMYYKNGNQTCHSTTSSNGEVPVEQRWALQRKLSNRSAAETESDLASVMALVMTNQGRLKNFVSNPNYISETQQLLNNSAINHISPEKIKFIKELGEGAFGRVYLGTVDHLMPNEPATMVAIKMLKETGSGNYVALREEFTHEAELLANLVHTNIISFYGISMDGPGTMMMLFEYMEYGDLNNFLHEHSAPMAAGVRNSVTSAQTIITDLDSEVEMEVLASPSMAPARSPPAGKFSRHLELQDLLRIATQIAAGMEYLASQRFVHRDLATRNCLVGLDLITKIGDFGMSRDVYATDYYRVVRDVLLPIRWMSPESIMYRKYTVESDCWSFGILLWEVLTYGKQPWYQYDNLQVIQQVTQGAVLEPPSDQCPAELYQIMLECWRFNPSERTPIGVIHHRLQQLREQYAQTNVADIPKVTGDMIPDRPGHGPSITAIDSKNCHPESEATTASTPCLYAPIVGTVNTTGSSDDPAPRVTYLELSH